MAFSDVEKKCDEAQRWALNARSASQENGIQYLAAAVGSIAEAIKELAGTMRRELP